MLESDELLYELVRFFQPKILAGQHVLYEVDEAAQAVLVLAVVGQRQNPGLLR